MTARLQTFGHLRLLDSGGNTIAFPEKALLILCYLHTRGIAEMSRSDAAGLFWDDAQGAAAYASLRQTVARTQKRQKEIGLSFLSFTDAAILLGPEEIESDVSQVNEEASLDHLSALLSEEFLKYVKAGNRTMLNWIALQRESNMALLRNKLLATATGTDRQARSAAAIRVLETNPSDEDVRAVLTGRPSAALVPAAPMTLLIGNPEKARAETAGPARNPPPRLVLLPPATVVNSRSAARHCDALIEDITIGLCAQRSVSIIAPHTAAQIATHPDKSATYERHRISYIVETKLREEGDGHSLYGQLIYFGSDEIIWAERFPLTFDGLARSRQMLANDIAGAIAARVEMNEITRSEYELDAETYRFFLSGQSELKSYDLRDVRRGRRMFRESLQLRSDYAPSMAGLAHSFILEWLLTARGDADLLKQAERHAEDAIRVDESLAAGHCELGVAKLYLMQFDASAERFARAEELSPNFANVIARHADMLIHAGEAERGLAKLKVAMDLNPLTPDEYFWFAAGASFALERYEDALGYIGQMKNKSTVHRLSAMCWAGLGDLKKAKLFVRRAYELNPNFDRERWVSAVPFKREEDRKLYADAMKKAGFR